MVDFSDGSDNLRVDGTDLDFWFGRAAPRILSIPWPQKPVGNH